MATPYVKQSGPNYNIQFGLPSGGVTTLQAVDSSTNHTYLLPAKAGTLALSEDSFAVTFLLMGA